MTGTVAYGNGFDIAAHGRKVTGEGEPPAICRVLTQPLCQVGLSYVQRMQIHRNLLGIRGAAVAVAKAVAVEAEVA